VVQQRPTDNPVIVLETKTLNKLILLFKLLLVAFKCLISNVGD